MTRYAVLGVGLPLLLCGALVLSRPLWLSGSSAGSGTVSGVVTFRDRPVPTGTVMLFTEQGQLFACLLEEDGGYQLTGVPPGPARLAVVAHPQVPPGLQRPPVQHPASPAPFERRDERRDTAPPDTSHQRAYVPIPQKYHKPEHSGLSLIVTPGAQMFNIRLCP